MAAEFGVVGGGAAEGHDRGGPPDDLLDGHRHAALEVRRQPRALLGEVGERLHTVRCGLPGGVVAGDDQQEEDRRDLLVGEPFAVDLGLHQCGHQVVPGLAAALLHQSHGDGVHGHDRLGDPGQRFGALQQARVTPAVGELRLVGDGAAVLLGDAHHVADVVHRDQCGHLGDEVDLALVGDVVDDAARVGDDVVVDARELLGCERRRDQPADLGVPRRVHRDETLGGVEQLLGERLEGDALTGEEVAGTPRHLHQIGMPDHGPEALIVGILEQSVAHRAVPGDRPLRAQFGEGLLAVGGGGRPELPRREIRRVVGTFGAGEHGGHAVSV